MVGKVWSTADCGVFVPADKVKPAKVFTIIGSGRIYGADQQPQPQQPAGPDAATTYAIVSAQPALQGAPLASGIGAGIGAGIVAGIVAAEQGRIGYEYLQPPGTILRDAFEGRVTPAPAAPAAATNTAADPPKNLLAVDAAR
jgi:hypothetical protein